MQSNLNLVLLSLTLGLCSQYPRHQPALPTAVVFTDQLTESVVCSTSEMLSDWGDFLCRLSQYGLEPIVVHVI